MKIWVIQDGEPIPDLDETAREWRTAMLCKTLAAAGHQIVWWGSTFDHAAKEFRFKRGKTVSLQQGLKLRLLHGPGYSHNKSLKRVWHHRVLAEEFYRQTGSLSKPDVIFASLPTLEFVHKSVKYGKRNSVPVIVDVRDLWPDVYLTIFPRHLRRLVRIILGYEYWKAESSLRQARGIVAVSDSYLAWALKMARRKQGPGDAIYPLGYKAPSISRKDLEHITNSLKEKWGLRRDKCNICYIGSFGASYDLATVIEAGKIVCDRGDNQKLQIILAGAGDQETALRRLAGGHRSVVFIGWLDKVSIAAVLSLSAVGLVPYKDDALQSLPNKPFEYMAAGLPLLSSLRGEMEDLIRQERIGVQYRAGEAESLAKQVLWLAEHPEERKEMGRKSRRFFEKRYDADIIYPKLARHLEFVTTEYHGMNAPLG